MLKNIILLGVDFGGFFNYELCTKRFFKCWNVYLVFLYEDILKKEYLEAKRYCMLKKAIRKKILKSRANSRFGAGEREIEK